MNLAKRIRAAVKSPKKNLRTLRPALANLEEQLREIKRLNVKRPLHAIVCFFATTSPWYDRGLRDFIAEFSQVNDGQYTLTIQTLRDLDGQFIMTGRSPYGLNRSERGDPVTTDNVYLGNIYGLFTLPISRWMKGENKPKSSWGSVRDKNPFDVVSDQAHAYVYNHIDIMIARVRELRTI